MKEIKIKKNSLAIVPMTPNFILVDGHATPIAMFTDNQLKQIGRAWTDKIIEIATERRKNKI